MLKSKITDNDWVSIYKDTPRVHERVLVICYNPDNHYDTHISICTYFGRNDRGIHLWSGHKHVSHWYPLPDLPNWAKGRGEF